MGEGNVIILHAFKDLKDNWNSQPSNLVFDASRVFSLCPFIASTDAVGLVQHNVRGQQTRSARLVVDRGLPHFDTLERRVNSSIVYKQ